MVNQIFRVLFDKHQLRYEFPFLLRAPLLPDHGHRRRPAEDSNKFPLSEIAPLGLIALADFFEILLTNNSLHPIGKISRVLFMVDFC